MEWAAVWCGKRLDEFLARHLPHLLDRPALVDGDESQFQGLPTSQPRLTPGVPRHRQGRQAPWPSLRLIIALALVVVDRLVDGLRGVELAGCPPGEHVVEHVGLAVMLDTGEGAPG